MSYEHNILIVDDKEENRYSLQSILKIKFKNIKTFEAQNGTEALKLALQEKVDLIILDIQMPDIDGFEVAKMLKTLQATRDIPIIFLTAFFKKDIYKDLGFKLGAIDYLTKPIDDNQLVNKIDLYLKLFDKTKKEVAQDAMLIQQSKMATMGEMLSAISHQWKQPLNSISLIIQNLDDAVEDSKISRNYLKETIERISLQINFMSESISDFKSFFTPSKEKSYFDIEKSIEDLLKIVDNRILSNSIDVDINADKCITIFGIENEFKHAILNIINNSIDAIRDYREKNSFSHFNFRGKIEINLKEREESIVIEIVDNGGGIKDEFLNQIFEPYFTSKGESGTGVGLYITKTIIDKLNGKINIENFKDGVKIEITIIKKD